MSKFWIILSHTFMTRLKSKAFIITTLITLLFIYGLANIQSIIEVFSNDEKDQVAVIDETEQLFMPLQESVQQTNGDVEVHLYEGTEEEGKEAIKDEEYKGLLILTLNEAELPEATYFSNNITEMN